MFFFKQSYLNMELKKIQTKINVLSAYGRNRFEEKNLLSEKISKKRKTFQYFQYQSRRHYP